MSAKIKSADEYKRLITDLRERMCHGLNKLTPIEVLYTPTGIIVNELEVINSSPYDEFLGNLYEKFSEKLFSILIRKNYTDEQHRMLQEYKDSL